MKYFISFLFLFLLSTLPTYSQGVQLDSPVYLGALLIEETDPKTMSEICRSYKYTEQPDEEGYTVYTSPDGEKIRFKIEDKTTSVDVTTNDKPTSIPKKLKQIGFKKVKGKYERGSKFSKCKTICTISSSPTTLYFSKSLIRPFKINI